jgi:hypothetical protein
MALALAAIQLFSPLRPPLALFVLFAGVWIFGAAMLLVAPAFGSVGTTVYGVLLAAGILQMHGPTALNLALAAGSLVGSALAAASLVVDRRRKTVVA